jgi:hypothetical protein
MNSGGLPLLPESLSKLYKCPSFAIALDIMDKCAEFDAPQPVFDTIGVKILLEMADKHPVELKKQVNTLHDNSPATPEKNLVIDCILARFNKLKEVHGLSGFNYITLLSTLIDTCGCLWERAELGSNQKNAKDFNVVVNWIKEMRNVVDECTYLKMAAAVYQIHQLGLLSMQKTSIKPETIFNLAKFFREKSGCQYDCVGNKNVRLYGVREVIKQLCNNLKLRVKSLGFNRTDQHVSRWEVSVSRNLPYYRQTVTSTPYTLISRGGDDTGIGPGMDGPNDPWYGPVCPILDHIAEKKIVDWTWWPLTAHEFDDALEAGKKALVEIERNRLIVHNAQKSLAELARANNMYISLYGVY